MCYGWGAMLERSGKVIRRDVAAAVVAVAVLAATKATAQPVALGDELVVNSYTTDFQTASSISSDASGSFVIVWSRRTTSPAVWSIHGQRFAVSGSAVGTEFQVNAADAWALSPAVAMADDGGFLVVWNGAPGGIAARSYDDAGIARGDAFRVDTTIYDDAHGYPHGYDDMKDDPDVAAGNDDRFMVVWGAGYNQYLYFVHSRRRIHGQIVSGAGQFVGTEFRVGGDLYYDAGRPNAETDAQGEFVVAWNQIGSYDYGYDDDGYYVRTPNYYSYGRRVDALGATPTSSFRIGGGSRSRPGLATVPSAGFVVAWARGAFAEGHEVLARRYDGAAMPLGTAVAVSRPAASAGSLTDAGRRGVDVDVADGGSFVVVWASGGAGYEGSSDGDGSGIFARTYAADGEPLGTEILVNSATSDDQTEPVVEFLDGDTMVVSWTSAGADGSQTAVVARRFARAPACGDASADGAHTSTDALIALATAVGIQSCAACVCDADASGAVTAADALRILGDAVGQAVALACTPC